MPPGLTSAGSSSVTAPTKPTWTSLNSLIHVAGTASSPVARTFRFAAMYCHSAPPYGLVDRVVRRHHPVDEVVVALVELVVADGRDLEARSVEGVDRRLVVLDERLERRGADEVAGGGEDRVRVRGAQLLHGAREHSGAGLAVVVLSRMRPWKSFVARICTWVGAAWAAGTTSALAPSAAIVAAATAAKRRRVGWGGRGVTEIAWSFLWFDPVGTTPARGSCSTARASASLRVSPEYANGHEREFIERQRNRDRASAR